MVAGTQFMGAMLAGMVLVACGIVVSAKAPAEADDVASGGTLEAPEPGEAREGVWPRTLSESSLDANRRRFQRADLFQRPVASTQPTVRDTTTRRVRLGDGRWSVAARVDERWTRVIKESLATQPSTRPSLQAASQPALSKRRFRMEFSEASGRLLHLSDWSRFTPSLDGSVRQLADWASLTNEERRALVRARWKTDLELAEWASQITVADYDQTRTDHEARLKYRYLHLVPSPWRYRVDRGDLVAFVGWSQRESRRRGGVTVSNRAIVSLYDRTTGRAIGSVAIYIYSPAGTLEEVADVAMQLAATIEVEQR